MNFRYPNSHPIAIHIQHKVHTKYIEYVKNRLQISHQFNEKIFLDNFFNCGVMMMSPTDWQPALDKFNSIVTNCEHNTLMNAHPEQALFNGIVHHFYGDRFYDIGYDWNYINPNPHKPMSSYIYHFTGSENIRNYLSNYTDWEV